MPNVAPSSHSSGDESSAEMDQDDEPMVDHRIRATYLAHLSDHMGHVRSHIAGCETNLRLTPSLILPSAHWTGEEKEAFFHGLSVHSRFRPDLIAEEVKTKNLAEVCCYMDLLEEALVSSRQPIKDVSTPRYNPISRQEFPIAFEASDEWVSYEDKLSEALAVDEPHIAADADQKRREEEIQATRTSLRARKGDAKVDGIRDRKGEKERKARFQAWLSEKKAEWEVRDLLDALDGTTLRAMDTLLREDEEARSSFETTGSRDPNIKLDPSPSVPATPDITADYAARMASFDEELIDPVLRALSSAPSATPLTAHQEQPAPEAGPSTPRREKSLSHDHFNPQTPPFSNSTPSVVTPLPATPLGLIGSDRARSSSMEPPLSPKSRRRFTKRMYMRRKRAAASGGAVDTTMARLRPGRKPKPLPTRSGGDDHDDDDAGDSDQADGASVRDDDTGEKTTRHPHASGKTLPYKIRERLQSSGINVDWLQQEGLDFFYLGGLSRLMRTYSSLYDASPEVNSQISADVIRLLLAHVVYFTTRLVRNAIVSREQEMMAKMHTKVWRLASNQVVTAANVAHASSLLGLSITNKQTHFQHLLEEFQTVDSSNSSDDDSEQFHLKSQRGRSHTSEAKEDGSDTDSEADTGGGDSAVSRAEDGGTALRSEDHPLLTVTTHRLVFPPFVRLPKSFQPSSQSSSHSLFDFVPWAHASSSEVPDEDEDLLTDETDDEALSFELQEEETLDENERPLSTLHEKGLWENFGPDSVVHLGKRKRKEDENVESVVDEREVHHRGKKSTRYRGPGGKIKSAVYVEDSD